MFMIVDMNTIRVDDLVDLGFVFFDEKIFSHEGVNLILQTNKIFGLIILIHANIFEHEINENTVVSEIIGKFQELKPEVFDELWVDVGDPSLDFDGYIFEKEVKAGVLFEELLQLDDEGVDETLDFFGFEEHVFLLKGVKLDSLAHHYFLFLQH